MEKLTCRCGGVLVRPATGRPPRYCSTACRRATEYDLRRAQQLLTRAERSEQTARMKADTWLVRRGRENPGFRSEATWWEQEADGLRDALDALLRAEDPDEPRRGELGTT